MARTKQTARRARSPIAPAATCVPNSSSTSHPHQDSTDEDTPPLSPPVQTGSTDNRITVINNSSLTRINLGMDFLEFSTMATVESGNAQEVSLRSFSKCFISLSQAGGVVLKETEDAKWCTWVQEWSTSYGVWAKPGAVLEFCNDPKNPPLSAKEYQSIEKLLLYYIEDSPPSGAQDSIDVWSLITNHLRRNSSTPKELHDLFFKTNQRPTPWNQLYAPVSVKNSYATAIRTALKEGDF
ncbi:hypothetical protein BDR26DRAFT_894118 [Obelidium mucronatum]|nr:hypothetical protein BDR26DRAFT_894118 [Obelidium mucronatum]